MKSIKEKQLLVKWAKAMGEPIDPLVVEEVERYERLQKELIESVKKNTIKDLSEASKVAEEFVKKINIEYPKPPTLDEVLMVLKEEQNELVQAQTPQTPQPTPTLAELAAEHITKEIILEKESFQQPSPPAVDKNLEAVQKKLKFLEQAIGRIAAHGPGSGETRFLRLDDVNYNSWQDRDRHKILKYEPNTNPAFDGITFGFLTGDQGPITSMQYDVTGYTSNANVGPGLTYYDSERDTLEILHKDGTATYTGLDNYIRVFNNGASGNITRGEFLVFIGVDPAGKVPKVGKFLADSNAVPIYSVGIAATNLEDNDFGRAIVLGELENYDATGNASGEVWSVGDVLWASPSQPGKLTKVQPTAPNVAISVAAVLDPSPNGKILVRPTVFPRLHYGEFFSNQNQVAPNTNFGHFVTFNNQSTTSGFTKNQGNTEITAIFTGLYNFRAKLQFTSSNASQQTIYIWGRKNGVDIPDSTIKITSTGNGSSSAPIWSRNVSMQAGDKMSILWAVSSTDVTLSASSTAFTPNTSSAVVVIHQVDL